MYIYTCSVQSEEHHIKTKQTFVYDSQSKTFHQPKCCEDIVDNRSDAPICVMDDNERESIQKLKKLL